MNVKEENLRSFHAPITDLFPRLRNLDDRKPYELSSEQLRFYRENGYVLGGRILTDAQIEVLREALERIRADKNPRTKELYEVDADYRRAPEKNVFHILGAWLIEEAFHDLLWHPAVTVKMSQLLDTPRVRLWHDQIFYKPARHPGLVTWHQDYSYWTRAYPPRHASIWIGLDDANLDNGCLHYVPGSHAWGLVPEVSLTQDMEAVKQHLTPDQLAAFKPVPMILKAGECVFHHSHLMHGSWGNRSDRPRRAIVLNYMHPETRCADGKSFLLAGVPVIPKDEIIQGDYFPIVLEG